MIDIDGLSEWPLNGDEVTGEDSLGEQEGHREHQAPQIHHAVKRDLLHQQMQNWKTYFCTILRASLFYILGKTTE